jgi:hypothetical protein
VHSMLKLLFDGMTIGELECSRADASAVKWWEQTLARCNTMAVGLLTPGRTLAAGDIPRQHVLQALGFTETSPGVWTQRSVRNTIIDDAPGSAAVASVSGVEGREVAPVDFLDAKHFCSIATTATGCTCYESSGCLRDFDVGTEAAETTKA